MEIKIKQTFNPALEKNTIHITLEMANETENTKKFAEYIQNFENIKVIVASENKLKSIKINDILYFYSNKKYNYCKTAEEEFKIKSKLYELEKINPDFLRISKSCVIHLQNVKCFDLGETGKIIAKFDDGSEQAVSRRKIRDVLNYLDERGI